MLANHMSNSISDGPRPLVEYKHVEETPNGEHIGHIVDYLRLPEVDQSSGRKSEKSVLIP